MGKALSFAVAVTLAAFLLAMPAALARAQVPVIEAPEAPAAPEAPEAPTAPVAPKTAPAPEPAPLPRPPDPPRVPEAPSAVAPPAPPLETVLPSGWFGFAMSCSPCRGYVNDGTDQAVWEFGRPPRVYSVTAGSPAARAGMRKGDQITHIDGVRITTDKGGRMFGAVKPGEKVQFRIRRGDRIETVTMTAEEYPAGSRVTSLRASDIREMEKALAEMRETQANLARERARMQAKIRREVGERERAELNAEQAELLMQFEMEKVVHLEELEARVKALASQLHKLRAEAAPVAPGVAKTLRYSGRLGSVDVVVRSARPVMVSKDPRTGELVISGDDLLIKMNENEE